MGKLFSELKRRKVFRVAAVYAVVAWLLIQVADTVLPALQMPSWTVSFVTVLFILGFPIALILSWAYENTPEGVKPDHQVLSSPGAPATSAQPINYLILAVVILVAVFQVGDRMLSQTGSSGDGGDRSSERNPGRQGGITGIQPQIAARTGINIGEITSRTGSGNLIDLALSSDGSRLAYSVQTSVTDTPRLYVRELNQRRSRLVSDTMAIGPFFSPDGEWLAYYSPPDVLPRAAMSLRKITFAGSGVQTLQPNLAVATPGYWADNDLIYFSRRPDFNNPNMALYRIPSNGGVSEPLNLSSPGELSSFHWPEYIEATGTLLYTYWDPGRRHRVLGRLVDGQVNTIVEDGIRPRYLPSGHLVFQRGNELWAGLFDPLRAELQGAAIPVIQGISDAGVFDGSTWRVSDTGLLVYLPDELDPRDERNNSLVWVDRNGNSSALPVTGNYRVLALSPDKRSVALVIQTAAGVNDGDIWLYDLLRNTLSRLTFSDSREDYPVWTPDSQRVVFQSTRGDGGIWARSADGSGQAEPLLTGDPGARPMAFSPDGSQLLFDSTNDIWVLDLDGESPPRPLLEQAAIDEERPALSPDGRWLAYVSDETGRQEVYVRPYPDVEAGKWQVSSSCGTWPKWSADGARIFYTGCPAESPDSQPYFSVTVTTDDGFSHDRPELLFSGSFDLNYGNQVNFGVSADGNRLLLLRGENHTAPQQAELVVVHNWFSELQRLVPAATGAEDNTR